MREDWLKYLFLPNNTRIFWLLFDTFCKGLEMPYSRGLIQKNAKTIVSFYENNLNSVSHENKNYCERHKKKNISKLLYISK